MFKANILIIAVIFLILIMGGVIYYDAKKSEIKPQINSFEECVKAGYSVLQSYPRQCKVDGKTFIEQMIAESINKLILPLDNALNRVTKKPFGIHVSPGNSPVNPEKFTGYHTGADFEIFPGEENKDISVFAICGGRLLVKEFGRGYGGMAVLACTINNQPATVVYGHLKSTSVKVAVGNYLNAGDVLGILGKGYTIETDYERKHLHLGIHKGSGIDTRGYVATASELNDWIDPLSILK